MTADFTIQNEKLNQAAALLQELNLDVWLTFVRETAMNPDPSLDLILGLEMTWLSAFLVTKNDERIAIVGRYDAEDVQRMGGFREVISYDESPFPELLKVLGRLNPEFIAVNYSESDVAADGLSHGMWLLLQRALAASPYKHRLVSAERLVGALRGRKSPAEVERVRTAIRTTESVIQAVTEKLAPGQNAVELAEFVQAQMREKNAAPAWMPCPVVTVGPEAPIGHAAPDAKYVTAPGQLVHMDLGVLENGYVSDLQRVWYLKKPDETGVPEAVQLGFEFVRGAILAAAVVLKPGVQGWEVDAASRQIFADSDYDEYQHAVGHQIGRSVHDGATTLAPRWARYGKTPEGIVEAGNIFTLELGLHLPDYGFIGLEEDVLVKDDGIEWLSTPQTDIFLVG